MKKFLFILVLLSLAGFQLSGQNATNFSYKLDNGITIKSERDWGHIWIQQKQDAFAAGEERQSVVIKVTTFGELTQNTTFKLSSGGKDVKLKEAAPGTYDLKITAKVPGKPGTVTFDASGIVVKAQMKTTVTVTIYKYHVNIDEAPGTNNGLAGYDSKVAWYKGNLDQTNKFGTITFYAKGSHDNKLTPDVVTNDLSGKIKPGTYDVLITLDFSGKVQKIWLENFNMKANTNYKITTNTNSGTVAYTGANRDVKEIYFYPAGTADRMQGSTKADKGTAILFYQGAYATNPCPPGSYDILLTTATGNKNEWKKNVVVRTGVRTDIK
ncbi:MAG: hypothetical protein U0T33_08840 [Bacteroidales bacterium]